MSSKWAVRCVQLVGVGVGVGAGHAPEGHQHSYQGLIWLSQVELGVWDCGSDSGSSRLERRTNEHPG